jgi:hypothetical protein
VSEPTPPQTVEEYKAAQQVEWGQYVAIEAIDIGGARAFNAGDPVPASHVKAGVVSATGPGAQVKKVATKTEATKAADEEKKG